ncbi:MAG: hypothetical protein HY889_00730 [Deltaproteobacteria bacterium]|nr:hypothetical protein [Deltaproteobacteria bacterium]
MAKSATTVFSNPRVTFRAMGEDVVIVNEEAGKVVILNASARKILNGLLSGATNDQIKKSLEEVFVFEKRVNIAEQIESVRTELLAANVILTKKNYENPTIKVRDLKTALKGLDLSRSTVSQYE